MDFFGRLDEERSQPLDMGLRHNAAFYAPNSDMHHAVSGRPVIRRSRAGQRTSPEFSPESAISEGKAMNGKSSTAISWMVEMVL